MMNFFKENWEAIVAILALLTSFVSVIISYHTFKLQRTHNIKSVKPIVHIGQWDYENELIVTLVNLGAGLAMIKKISVRNKVDEFKNSIYDWMPKKLGNDMNYKEYWTGFKNFAVQPGQIIELIKIPIDTSKAEQVGTREKLRAILRQLTVCVTYEDIYEREMPKKEMELHLFSRTDNENG
jgi:NADH:ubiquinone oxidoreductase subunit 5 (subunit L)/multisubunit Na+/H+ antiporter MnhA subunit